MAKLTVVATLKAKSDKIGLIKEELVKLHKATHANDEGCIQYDLHTDNEDPSLFLVFENWASAELLTKHAESAHFQAFMAAVDGAFEMFEVKQMTQFA